MKKSEITECSNCGVPSHLHNTCCGWENASVIPMSHLDNINISGEEKKQRWEYAKTLTNTTFTVVK